MMMFANTEMLLQSSPIVFNCVSGFVYMCLIVLYMSNGPDDAFRCCCVDALI